MFKLIHHFLSFSLSMFIYISFSLSIFKEREYLILIHSLFVFNNIARKREEKGNKTRERIINLNNNNNNKQIPK